MTDTEQFTSLFIKHERQFYGFIAAMLGHPAEAEDLLQETAKGLWKKFSDYDPSLAVSSVGQDVCAVWGWIEVC